MSLLGFISSMIKTTPQESNPESGGTSVDIDTRQGPPPAEHEGTDGDKSSRTVAQKPSPAPRVGRRPPNDTSSAHRGQRRPHNGRQEDRGNIADAAAHTDLRDTPVNEQTVVAELPRSGKQSDPRRHDHRAPRDTDLAAELQKARIRGKRLEEELSRVQEERRTGLQREEDLHAALAEAEKRLQALKAESVAARVFGETEEVDGKAVLDLFGDVVDGINDLAFCVVEKLDEDALASALVLEHLHELKTTNPLAGRIVYPFLALMVQTNAKVERVALPAMQCMAFSLLMTWFFHPLGLSELVPQEVGEYIKRLLSRMASLEPQEQYGRWRSMTHNAMRAPSGDTKLAQFFVGKILDGLGHVFTALCPPRAAQDDMAGLPALDDLRNRTTKVVIDAMKLQDTMQRVYVSRDYSVFFTPTHSHYSASEMEITDLGPDMTNELADAIHQAECPRGIVLLPISPGLRARRVGPDHSHSDVVVRKVSVIALL